jgi:transcriptional regulator with XRE-family HTH domain
MLQAPHELAKTVGSALRELRLRRGITQAEVSRRTGIQRPIVARLESGRAHVPTLVSILRCVHACGYTLRDFTDIVEPAERSEVV